MYYVLTRCNKDIEHKTVNNKENGITMQQSVVDNIVEALLKSTEKNIGTIERCVNQTAYLWRDSDGDENQFLNFV